VLIVRGRFGINPCLRVGLSSKLAEQTRSAALRETVR
jgi:hypothetical protein